MDLARVKSKSALEGDQDKFINIKDQIEDKDMGYDNKPLDTAPALSTLPVSMEEQQDQVNTLDLNPYNDEKTSTRARFPEY